MSDEQIMLQGGGTVPSPFSRKEKREVKRWLCFSVPGEFA
jgi:hypothetical protein